MTGIMKTFGAIIIAAYFILYPQKIFAQAIASKDGLGQSCVSIKDDMKSYEVVYKIHAKEYTDYYRVLKDKIVRKLKNNYKDHYADADVDMYFVLNPDGSLRRIDFDLDKSTSNKDLLCIALLSLQQAAPFPPFPKELDAEQLPFNVMVSFKKR